MSEYPSEYPEYAFDVPMTVRIYAGSHEEAVEKMHRLTTDARHLQYVQGLNVSAPRRTAAVPWRPR